MPMLIQPLDPESPGARRLIALSDAYLAALYPPESNHLETVEALLRPNVCFIGGHVDDELMACGAVKTLRDADGAYGEVKRVFVIEPQRGRGWSKSLMTYLEQHLRQQAVPLVRLETGIHQPEALGLYRRLGYRERAPFGAYRIDPYSVFMEKRLDADRS
jgi:putative acetyltransferase